MSTLHIHPDVIQQHSRWGERLRSAGLALVACSESGDLARPINAASDDWLADLFCQSPLFAALLKDAAKQWSQQEQPCAHQSAPGLWLVPMPLMSRRRRVGYSVAVIPTEALLTSEQLVAICQSAHVDFQTCRRRLENLPPASDNDIDRLTALVRFAHEDHLQLEASSQAVESVGRQLAESYEEINLLYTIIQGMTVQKPPERFVALACQELLATLPYAWIGAQLIDDRSKLKSLAGRMVLAGKPRHPAPEIRRVAVQLIKELKPESALVLEPMRNPRHSRFAHLGETVLVQPIASSASVLGIMLAGDKRGPDTAASSVDLKLLGATATHMAIHLENAALYEDLNTMFLGTLEALTASIDAKDRYTCGHSRRVAHLTKQLAQAIGLEDPVVERMHIAGLVHDVGKIGVPEAVLLKPGKLTAEEFAWIRKHPEIGYRILKDIPQLEDVLPGVLYHHERWDGTGYPHKLKGEGIPLIARLIGLADAFDAMSSTRTYRSSLSRGQVLDEIERCSGSQFDPSLASVFVKLDFSDFDRLVHEHRALELEPGHSLRREDAA